MSSHSKDLLLLSLKEKEECFILGQSVRGSGSGSPWSALCLKVGVPDGGGNL